MPAGTRDPNLGPNAPDGVDDHVLELMPLERDERVRPQRLDSRDRAAEVAETLLADGEDDGPARELAAAEQPLDDVDGDGDRGCVVADSRADQVVALGADGKDRLRSEDRVDVCQQREARRALPPGPEEVSDRVPGPLSRSPRKGRSSHAIRASSENVGAGIPASSTSSSIRPRPHRAVRRRAKRCREQHAVDVRARVDRASVGDVVSDGDMRAARDPLELESRAAGARGRIQPDRDLREIPHPLVARPLDRIERRHASGPVASARRPASKRSSTALASWSGPRKSSDPSTTTRPSAVPSTGLAPDLDVRRRRVATGLVGDAPERPAEPAVEAARADPCRPRSEVELGRGVEVLGEAARRFPQRGEVDRERPVRTQRRPGQAGNRQIPGAGSQACRRAEHEPTNTEVSSKITSA